ncbi:hypothetical protein ACSCBZ_42360 [Streptomyces niveiscabiei]|uniref:hypothetical protein n=1 Tax=Streptomyces niveiscabiei TaxID=164115 RepID=UPI0006EB3435|nr:hypothetical protein [Streptomyces niveiscabiei]
MTEAATGVPTVDTAVAWSVAISAIAGLTTLVWQLLRAVRRIAGWAEEIRDDWVGTPGRPGVPARPGVMPRLGAHDDQLDEHGQRLDDHERRITRVETRIPDGT